MPRGIPITRPYTPYSARSLQGVIRSTFIIDVDADGTGRIAVAQYNVRASGHVARLRRELGV